MKKLILFLIAVLSLVIITQFAFSEHTHTPTSLTINRTQNYGFNITVNNTDAGQDYNITQVNITLASGFTFITNTNGSSDGGASFVNTSNLLSWTNVTDYIINGSANQSFWFNATAPSVPGYYNFTIASLNASTLYYSNFSVLVNDITKPVITLISPNDKNSTTPPTIVFYFNVSEHSATNCSLILNGAIWNFNSSVNITGGTQRFVNFTVTPSNTWSINCTDAYGNTENTSTFTLNLLSLEFNGTIKDDNGAIVNNSVINVTVKDQAGWTIKGSIASTSNESGWFRFNITSNSSWVYEISMIHRNSTWNHVDLRSKALPAFNPQMLPMIAGTTFYLSPSGTINLTAVNSTGGRTAFQYQIKDTSLGYPIAEDHTNWLTEAILYVPSNRNYSIMLYPNQSMPASYNWNNFSSTTSYQFNYSSSFNATTKTLHKQFNMSMTMASVSGYVTNASGTILNGTNFLGWSNFTVIPYLLEPGNMIHSEYGDMPYNLSSSDQGQSDTYILASGFFNISVPATAETSNLLLFATLKNESQSRYFGGFKNISISYGTVAFRTNITVYGLLGNEDNVTMDRIDGAGRDIAIPTSKQKFFIVNASNSTLTSTSAHVEIKTDYSAYGLPEFTWMSDVQQSQSIASFAVPLLNISGIKEMNLFVNGGPSGSSGQYAPKRVSIMTAGEIIANNNITVKTFNPQALDGTTGASISIVLFISNSTCDVPSPPSECYLTATTENMETFNPMKAVMGGGKISFRMGLSGVLVHYVNVDLLASGPPDALFEDNNDVTEATSSGIFGKAMRFGSQGPTVYDYVLISMPYTEGSSSTSGLNETAQVNLSIPTFYDDNWNAVWSTSQNGTDSSAFAGNNSHYSTFRADWQVLMNSNNTCTVNTVSSSTQINSSSPCYIDKTNNRIWVRLPHFSGTGPSVAGTSISATTAATTTASSSSAGTATTFWTSTIVITDASFQEGSTKELATKHRVKVKVSNTDHYVGVVNMTSTTVTINVSSTPQQATLAIGDEKKFEVSGDNYYDVLVRLNGIKNSMANVTIKSIHEAIQSSAPVTGSATTTGTGEEESATTPEGETTTGKAISNQLWFWVVIVVIVLVIVFIVYTVFSHKKKRYYSFGY